MDGTSEGAVIRSSIAVSVTLESVDPSLPREGTLVHATTKSDAHTIEAIRMKRIVPRRRASVRVSIEGAGSKK